MSQTAYRARILHFIDNDKHQYFADGLLICEGGYIKACGDYNDLANVLHKDAKITHYKNHIIMPGFIDAHVHFPQIDIIAAYGKKLMHWLDKYTFPEETKFFDKTKCDEAAEFFLDELLKNGTTTALVFGTVHEQSAESLFEKSRARNMRMIAGKVLMDRNAPDNLLDGDDLGKEATERLIKKWHNKYRLGYAITPRFAPTSTPKQLQMAGELKTKYQDVLVHTHMCETKQEIDSVAKLFPHAQDYLNVYEQYGLVGKNTVLAHGIYMGDDMCGRIAKAGASICLCPTSNLFMGSGLFNWARLNKHKISLALGTDIGGGTSFSQFASMKSAYEIAHLGGDDLSAFNAFYLATLGGAKALGLDKYIGNFESGKEADFVVLDLAATPLLARRIKSVKTLHELLFVLMILADDRAVAATAIMGHIEYERGGTASNE